MKSHAAAFARGAVSLSILAVILVRTPVDALVARAQAASVLPLLLALLLVFLMAVLVAVRWRRLASWLGVAMPPWLALRAMFLGLFAGQLLPSAIGTDLFRGSIIARHTGQIRSVAASLVADRLVALFAACLLLLPSQALLSRLALPFAGAIAPLAVLCSGAALATFLLVCAGWLKVHSPQGERVRPPRLTAAPVLGALALALAVHGIAIATAACAAAAYGIDASPRLWLSIVPMSIIACAVPISINGWGVRESVMMAFAAMHGLAPAEALLVSLTVGGLNILASLPGAVLLLQRPASA